MEKPSLGWQSWSPPFSAWLPYPKWDYSPFEAKGMPKILPKNKKINIKYWCSWYAYGWNIDETKIRKTLQTIKKRQLDFTHILIDDGWAAWGDWDQPNLSRFPDIMNTVQAIHSNHLKVGLWFAPFLANKNSLLYHNHPDWFIKYHNRPVQGLKTIPVWEWLIPQQYLLDLANPAVKNYLTNFIDLAVKKWKVDLLKLDFLYAPYFNPNLKSDNIPHNQVTWLLQYIKSTYPKITTIACGAPFSSSLNYSDVIRISKDTALPPPFPNFINRLVYYSRVKMLAQKMLAAKIHKNLVTDPDVRMFSLDNRSTKQVWNNHAFSCLGVGDNLTRLSRSNINILKKWLETK